MIAVSSLDDPRIEAFRSVRDRDLAGRDGYFVAEGEVVLRVLLSRQSRFAALSVLISTDRVRPLAPLLAGVPEECPVYVAEPALLAAIVGFDLHRGVLALSRRGPEDGPHLLAMPEGERGMALGLVGIANHDNVGGAFRNAAAFGARAVLLDAASCDPLYRKAIRVSVGGTLAVPFWRGGSPDDMLERFRLAGFEPLALSPAGRETLADIAWPERAAILVGAEGHGLPPAIIARCRSVRIPMAGGFDSLNVATATGIALHAWLAATRPPPPSVP